MKEKRFGTREEYIGKTYRTPSTIIRPEDRQAWLESRSRDNIPPVPTFAANSHRRNSGKLPYAYATEEPKDTVQISHENDRFHTTKSTAANAADKKELNNMMNNPQSITPAKPTKKWASFKSKLINPAKGKMKTVFHRFIKFNIPPILIALIILIAAEMVPDFKENYEVLYRCADFFVSFCEELLHLGVNSLNLVIHFVAQLFGHEDPTALDSFLKSIADIWDVVKSFWLYIRAF